MKKRNFQLLYYPCSIWGSSMQVKCSRCSKSLVVRPELFGKQVKCPGCAQTLKISAPKQPAPTAPTTQPDSLTIACQCSKKLRVPATARGKNVKCPSCQITLQVPLPTAIAMPVVNPVPVAQPNAFSGPDSFPDDVFDSLPPAQPQPPGSYPVNPYLQAPGASYGQVPRTAANPYQRSASSRPAGGACTYVVYSYAISIIVLSFHFHSQVKCIPPGGSRFFRGLPYTFFSMVFGLWGIPWGPIFTIMSIVKNCAGGEDVTAEVRANSRV